MIRLAFNLASFFWLLAPCAFLVGKYLGVWDFKQDIAVFAFLMVMMLVVAFLNYSPNAEKES